MAAHESQEVTGSGRAWIIAILAVTIIAMGVIWGISAFEKQSDTIDSLQDAQKSQLEKIVNTNN